jgi:hypothetical protein
MYEQMLAYLNVSQTTLEHIILLVVAVLIVGTILVAYWQYLIAGAVACFCFVVFTHGTSSMADNDGTNTLPAMQEKKYIEECVSLTNNKKMCKELWEEHLQKELANSLQESAFEKLMNNKPESE